MKDEVYFESVKRRYTAKNDLYFFFLPIPFPQHAFLLYLLPSLSRFFYCYNISFLFSFLPRPCLPILFVFLLCQVPSFLVFIPFYFYFFLDLCSVFSFAFPFTLAPVFALILFDTRISLNQLTFLQLAFQINNRFTFSLFFSSFYS